jgi:hypothetical protein
MTSELLEATKAAVQRGAGPMTTSQIWAAVKREMSVPGKDRFSAETKESLPGSEGIYVWPEFRRSPLFCSRPLAACVEEALLKALDEEPLTVTKAVLAVKKALRKVPEKHIVKEIKVLLPRQTQSGVVIRLPVGQSAIYLSRNWMADKGKVDGGDSALTSLIRQVIARLQSISGTYVRIDHLRNAPELCAVLNRTLIELADAGELVLSRYDGPRPVPEENKWIYVEDEAGELFIGVALTREREISG